MERAVKGITNGEKWKPEGGQNLAYIVNTCINSFKIPFQENNAHIHNTFWDSLSFHP